MIPLLCWGGNRASGVAIPLGIGAGTELEMCLSLIDATLGSDLPDN